MSSPETIDGVSVGLRPFAPSEALQHAEEVGSPDAAAMRVEEEAAHASLIANAHALGDAITKSPSDKPAPVDRVEAWAAKKSTPAWLLRAAAVGAKWEVGEAFDPCLVTEAEFDRAVAFAENPHAALNPPKKQGA